MSKRITESQIVATLKEAYANWAISGIIIYSRLAWFFMCGGFRAYLNDQFCYTMTGLWFCYWIQQYIAQ